MNENITESQALTIAINYWIDNNQEVVQTAQDLAKITIHLGLVDTSTTLPFQIFPTNTYDAKGMPYCDLFLNIDHAAKGFYTIKINNGEYTINPPSAFSDEARTTKDLQEIVTFIEDLAHRLDPLYEFLNFIEKNDEQNANQKLQNLLQDYRDAMDEELAKMREYVRSIHNVVIAAPGTNAYDFVKNAVHNFDQAFLHPSNWFILDDVPEKGESFEDYINEEASAVLFDAVSKFFSFESQHSAYMYLAQKIISDNGWSGRIYSETTETWRDIERGQDNIVYTLPVIDASKIELSKTHKRRK